MLNGQEMKWKKVSNVNIFACDSSLLCRCHVPRSTSKCKESFFLVFCYFVYSNRTLLWHQAYVLTQTTKTNSPEVHVPHFQLCQCWLVGSLVQFAHVLLMTEDVLFRFLRFLFRLGKIKRKCIQRCQNRVKHKLYWAFIPRVQIVNGEKSS